MKDIAAPNEEHSEMCPIWDMVDDVMGGTRRMRLAGQRYLQKWEAESERDYTCRLAVATFLPVYGETIKNLTGRVFAKPVAANDDIGTKVKMLVENIDREGNDLNEFAAKWFSSALAQGVYYAFVDQTRTPGAVTRADTLAAGARAYATLIHPRDVLGWKIVDRRLVQLRILESYEVEDGPYHVKNQQQVRLLEPGRWEVHRKGEDGKWALFDEGTSATKEIALVALYTGRVCPMVARPPLLDLLYKNVKHWNEQSDQDNSVRFARIRMGFLIGVDDAYELKLSADSFTKLPMGADAKIVQGSAESVKIGRSELDALMQQMRESGSRLLQKEASVTKAVVQAKEDSISEQSALARMGQALEDSLDQVLIYMAEIESESPGSVTVSGNYEIDSAPEQTVKGLTEMATLSIISKQRAYEEAQRHGILSDARTWEEEKELIDQQGPSLGEP